LKKRFKGKYNEFLYQLTEDPCSLILKHYCLQGSDEIVRCALPCNFILYEMPLYVGTVEEFYCLFTPPPTWKEMTCSDKSLYVNSTPSLSFIDSISGSKKVIDIRMKQCNCIMIRDAMDHILNQNMKYVAFQLMCEV
jgi:hypothetical protein